jgi:DNA-binding CsgD family transcriptional regulator
MLCIDRMTHSLRAFRKSRRRRIKRRQMPEGLLHASTPGLFDALCDFQAMGIWETLRGANSSGLSAPEVAAELHLPLALVQTTLDRLISLGLVKSRPAGRGRRTTTFCVAVPELHVSFSDLDPGLLAELFARWHESRTNYFELMLKHHAQREGAKPRGFCASGWAKMTMEERAKLSMLIDQIGSLIRNTARRKSPVRGRADNRPDQASPDDSRIYGVLLRVADLASEPPPQPNIKFFRGAPPQVASNSASAEGPKARNGLAPRERQVADAMAAGLSRPEIARQLGLSPNTVVTVSGRVYRKLGVRNRAELVRAIAHDDLARVPGRNPSSDAPVK